jgi:hypothetical protein
MIQVSIRQHKDFNHKASASPAFVPPWLTAPADGSTKPTLQPPSQASCRDLTGHYSVTGVDVSSNEVTFVTQEGCSGTTGGQKTYTVDSVGEVTMDGLVGQIVRVDSWDADSLRIVWTNGQNYTRTPGGPHYGQYQPGAQNFRRAKRVLLTNAADQSDAKCLDGSPGAYYFRPGDGSGKNKWFIHHEGGGWCTNLDECVNRSKTSLGSSTFYPGEADLGGGYFSQDPAANPMLHNWNFVLLKYCDGGIFTGSSDSPVQSGQDTVYFRGYAILTAMQKDLLEKRGVDSATDVVMSGCSAGGLASFLHCDDWAEKLKPHGAKVVCMSDSGFFPESQTYWNKEKWVFEEMNSAAGVNKKCIEDRGATGDSWKCMLAEHNAPFLSTPTFLLQPIFDYYQSAYILGLSGTSDSDKATINELGQNITALVKKKLLDSNPENGAFLDCCAHHTGGWGTYRVQGKTAPVAFEEWYGGVSPPNQYYRCGQTYPCQDCC